MEDLFNIQTVAKTVACIKYFWEIVLACGLQVPQSILFILTEYKMNPIIKFSSNELLIDFEWKLRSKFPDGIWKVYSCVCLVCYSKNIKGVTGCSHIHTYI